MHLLVSARSGTKPRRRRLQYLEKWNRDSRQDSGIDLVRLWNRLKGPRNKDFLFLDKSCCSLDKNLSNEVLQLFWSLPSVEVGCGEWSLCLDNPWALSCFFQWPIAHQLLNKMLCGNFYFFSFFLPVKVNWQKCHRISTAKILHWDNRKKKIVDCKEMVLAENQTCLDRNNNNTYRIIVATLETEQSQFWTPTAKSELPGIPSQTVQTRGQHDCLGLHLVFMREEEMALIS